MANWSNLKASIAEVIKTNGNREITGAVLQSALNSIISNVGANATFAGIATPSTNPGAPDGNVFYLVTAPGTYSNFGGIQIADEEAVILEWRGSWVKKTTGLVTAAKLAELDKKVTELNISVLYPTSGIEGTNKYDFATAIAQVPSKYRTYVGLKITFINNTTNKPESWTYNGGTFTSTTSWTQGDGGGNKILEWNTDFATTRKQVPLQVRKPGMQISYLHPDKGWINEQYIGTNVYNTQWALDLNWNTIAIIKDLGIINVDSFAPREGYYTSNEARLVIPNPLRKKNLIITYQTSLNNVIVEQFKYNVISDSTWSADEYWLILNTDRNYRIVEWNTDSATTRKQILIKDRKQGMLLSYTDSTGDRILEMYTFNNIYDKSWSKDSYWVRLSNYTYVDEHVSDINISALFPTNGFGGSNRYTIDSAIQYVPDIYKRVGLKITFVGKDSVKAETWMYYSSGDITDTANWVRIDNKSIINIEWNTDTSTTRKQVSLAERSYDLLLRYKDKGEKWVIEQYYGPTLYDGQWGLDSNWVRIASYNEVLPGIYAEKCINGIFDKSENLIEYINSLPETLENYGCSTVTNKFQTIRGVTTYVFPILPSKTYKWSIKRAPRNTNHALLDNDGEIIKLFPNTGSFDYATEQTLEAPDNAYFFALVIEVYDGTEIENSYLYCEEALNLSKYSLSSKIKDNKEKIEAIEKELHIKKDFSIINIPYVFGMVNPKLYSREYVVRMFPESLLDVKPDTPATVNYRRDVAFSKAYKAEFDYSDGETNRKTITLRAEGYNDASIDVKFHVMGEKVFSDKNIRLCLFGVSFDAIDYRSDDGTNEEGGTTTTALLEKFIRMSAKDNEYNVSYTSIGTGKHGFGDTFSYGGEILSCRGRHEARGGRNGIAYLRQPIHFSPQEISYDPNVSGTTATGVIQWLMNGLRYRVPYNKDYSTSGTDYGEFELTVDKMKALRYTPFGKYHHDYAKELWDFCNSMKWITEVGEEFSEWADTDEQKGIIDKCMDYIADNPHFPFFDIQTARETSYIDGVPKDINDNSQYALNYNKYLERYRTLDDLGVRLTSELPDPSGQSVVGSDMKSYKIGTKINTQRKLSDIDVCVPTHVIWDMAYNDWTYYLVAEGNNGQANGTESLANSELFISAIKEQLGSDIIFGLKAKKANGAFYPDVWTDIAFSQGYTPSNHLTEYNKLMISKYSDLSKRTQWIPIFPVAIPFASNFSQEFEDFVYDKTLVCSVAGFTATSDFTHEGLRCAKAMTYQIYGWLAYTIVKENELVE